MRRVSSSSRYRCGKRALALTVAGFVPALLAGVLAGPAAAAPDDAAAEAQRLVDTVTVPYTFGGSSPAEFTQLGDLVIFAATNRYVGRELFATDGTEAGTRVVIDLVPGALESLPRDLIEKDGFVYFTASTIGRGRGAWRTDGTAQGTIPVDEMPAPPDPPPLVAGSDDVRDLEFLSVETDGLGYELWRSDGTEAGTYLVKDINPGMPGSNPGEFTRVGDVVFFEAKTEATGRELWKTDGTPEGTLLVKDLRPGPNWGATDALTNFEDRLLLFTGWDVDHAAELWRSDGTEEGTYLVKDIDPTVNQAGTAHAGRPIGITDMGDGTAYFSAALERAKRELWRTDGTEEGTYLVADIEPDFVDGHVESITAVAGGAFFTAGSDPGGAGRGLWATDGTPEGTTVANAGVLAESYPQSLTAFGDSVAGFFGTAGFFQSGGITGPGTLVTLPLPASAQVSRDPMTPLGDRLLFTVEIDRAGHELWVTDGTPEGSQRLENGSNYNDRIPGDWAYLAEEVFFGNSLLRSDGTPAGTEIFFPVTDDLDYPNSVVVVDRRVLFVARNRATGLRHIHVYEPDSDESSIVRVIDVHQFGVSTVRQFRSLWGVGGYALFVREGSGGLWKTDGTLAGTQLVADIVAGWNPDVQPSVSPWAGPSADCAPVRVGSRVLFSAITAEEGVELWRLDDGELGATLVADIAPGPTGSRPNGIVPLGSSNYAVFAASDPAHGMELWITDGTEAGTRLLADVRPGALPSNPRNITLSGTDIVFAATGDEAGVEPWVVSLAGLDLPESAFDGGATMPSGAPLGIGPAALGLDRVRVKLDFRRRGRDRVTLRGTVNVPADFVVENARVVIDIEGESRSFVLSQKGRAKTDGSHFRVRAKKGVAADDGSLTIPFTAKLKGDFQPSLFDAGLTSDAGPLPSERVVTVSMLLAGSTQFVPVTLDYKVKRRRGKASEQDE